MLSEALTTILLLVVHSLLFVNHLSLPVVPRKAVAEVLKIGHYRRGELL